MEHRAGSGTRTAAVALLAVAIAMTWPVARLWPPEIPNQPDASFNVWRLAWVAHQLREDPTRLFEANIFSPAAHTLAYSDAMPLMGFAGAPLMWAGVHPFAVHNLLLVAAFWSASYFTYRLCLRLTSNQWASLIGGIVSGYAPYRFGHVSHLELLWTAFLPLGLSTLLRLHEQPSLRASLRLALFVVLQTLCSIYYGIYFAIYLALASLALAIRNRGAAVSRVAIALAMAAAFGLVALLPYVLMYRAASTLVEHRTGEEIARFSATPLDYLHVSPEHELPLPRSEHAPEERSLYPGLVAVVLAIIGLAVRPGAAAIHTVLLVLSVDLSFGTNGLLYPQLLDTIPPLSNLRAPARFGAFVILSLSVLTALGAARLLEGRRSTHCIGAVLVALTLGEYWSAPVNVRSEPMTPPRLYAWLAQQPKEVIAELPLPVPERLWGHETEYQLMSIYHWQRLAHGYSGNAPNDYIRFLNHLRSFPGDNSLNALRAKRVRWIVIHEALFDSASLAALLEEVTKSGALRLHGTYADRWGRATVLELLPTTL